MSQPFFSWPCVRLLFSTMTTGKMYALKITIKNITSFIIFPSLTNQLRRSIHAQQKYSGEYHLHSLYNPKVDLSPYFEHSSYVQHPTK